MRGFGDYADDGTASAMKARDFKDVTDIIVDAPAARAVALRGREGGGSIEMGGATWRTRCGPPAAAPTRNTCSLQTARAR